MSALAKHLRALAAKCRRLARQADDGLADALNEEAKKFEAEARQQDKLEW